MNCNLYIHAPAMGPVMRRKNTVEESTAARSDSRTASKRIFDSIRADIISGKLPPGQKLKVAELCKTFGTSGSPVREALSLLASNLLVEHIERRGFRVSAINQKEFTELLNTRCWAEDRALRESIRHGGTEWTEKIVLVLFRLSQTPHRIESGEVNPEWEALHKTFHMTLLEECPSRFLRDFCDNLYNQNIRYRLAASSGAYSSRFVFEEHQQIADAVIARDADLAVDLLTRHYRTTANYLYQFIDS